MGTSLDHDMDGLGVACQHSLERHRAWELWQSGSRTEMVRFHFSVRQQSSLLRYVQRPFMLRYHPACQKNHCSWLSMVRPWWHQEPGLQQLAFESAFAFD